MKDWHLYLVRARDGSLYAGIATDVSRRLAEHERGGGRGAKSLRSKGPLELAYQTRIGDRALALRAERRVKRLGKDRKESIVAAVPTTQALLSFLGLEGSAFESDTACR